MDSNIIVAIVSCLGTVLGSALGVIAGARLTNYRIEQLEKKVDKHNTVIERTFVMEEKVKVINHRLNDLEKEHNHE